MAFVAEILSRLGILTAEMSEGRCTLFILDEPLCPKSLIK